MSDKSDSFITPEELLLDIDEQIEKRGWAMVFVASKDKPYKSFVHTIGFDQKGYPELLAFEVPQECVFPIFQCLMFFWDKNGETLGEVDIVNSGYMLRLVEIDESSMREFMWPKYYHLRENGYDTSFRAIQVIFPDEDGCSFEETPEQPFLPEIDF